MLKQKSKHILFVSLTLLIVFAIYSFSLLRPWLPFDERLFYNEILFPIPQTFSEIFEIISSFVVNSHIESSNTFFSNHQTIREAPIAWIIYVFLSYFFKTNSFYYHLFQLLIHLINTTLVWLIIYFTIKSFNNQLTSPNNNNQFFFISLLTLIWALHSANTEAVLLATNWNALLSFTFCFAFLLYEIYSTNRNNLKISKLRMILISVLFFLAVSLVEQVYTFPLAIFLIVFAYVIRRSKNIKGSFITSLKLASPYFIGLFLFVLFSFFRSGSPLITNFYSSQHSSIYLFIERNLWFTPQIFVHFLKLLIFPKVLSTYQSNFVYLSKALFENYSIFCTLFYLLFLSTPIISFFLSKNRNYKSISLIVYGFFFVLFPFLHILTPTYCLSADRYCYLPSFIFLLLVLNILLFFNFTATRILKPVIGLFFCITLLIGIRTTIRIQDWRNPYTFYNSAIRIEKTWFYKAQRHNIFANYLEKENKKDKAKRLSDLSLKELYKAQGELRLLKQKYPKQPETLINYGLDHESLLQKAAYLILAIRTHNNKTTDEKALAEYESGLQEEAIPQTSEETSFYAQALLKAGKLNEAEKILNPGVKRFPRSSLVLNTIADLYLIYKNDPDKAFPFIQISYKYFPNDPVILSKFYKYYELKKDPLNQAKFAYLLGLRNHDPISYQKAVQIYLDLNQVKLANKSINKLILLSGETPVALLFLSRYFDLIGQREKIIPLLNKAYILTKTQEGNNIQVTKSILASLINITLFSGKTNDAQRYLSEFEQLENLTKEDMLIIKELKLKLTS